MIISNHGILQLLVTSCALAVVICTQNATELVNRESSPDSKNRTKEEIRLTDSNGKSVAEMVKSHRRSPRFDTAASSPWVRVYNRPPGSQSESYYNYETRGNTSAHTSVELWDSLRDDLSGALPAPIERSDKKVKDLLRVKPKTKEEPRTDVSKSTTESTPVPKTTLPSTKSPDQTNRVTPARSDAQKKGYIIWSSNDGESSAAWTLDDSSSAKNKKEEPTVEEMIPKDGSHWKVVGDGGEGGWEVIDDKGEVEWKIEYDDGEWRVTSTGDVPADAEWIDPQYVWGPPGDVLPQDDEYSSYPADEYGVPPTWPDPQIFLRQFANDSWIKKDTSDRKKQEEIAQTSESGWKNNESPDNSPRTTNEKVQFGTRKKSPTSTPISSSAEDNIRRDSSEEVNSDATTKEQPQSDQGILRSWLPESPPVKSGQKWIQGYGTKTWEGDNSGWNAEVGGETWIAADKNYDVDPWVPKIPGAKNPPQTPTEESNTSKQDNSVRAWGTGYGSKTWKGDEWNSNVVWKTGFNSGLPWGADNSTWKFPQKNEDKKKPQVWSQPIPANKETTGTKKSTLPPSKGPEGIRIKWPLKPVNRGNAIRKYPPSRRQENESWDDDSSIGGVIWVQQEGETSTQPAVEMPKSNDQDNDWQSGGWKVSTPVEEWKATVAPWKNKVPIKNSNLISVTWKAGDNPTDNAPDTWDQGNWPDVSGEPTWIFKGCKMTLKCGSNNDDSDEDQSNLPDTSDDDTMIPTTTLPPTSKGKIWPSRPSKGKSWNPPTKSWRPPKWKKPTPAPIPPETMNPMTTWKIPPPPAKWSKPTPPPDMWKIPPSTMMWTETTPEPPKMSWKPSPPPIKWKKGPKPTKSWRPPPTKSWKPPKQPTKTWEPSIATPQPDMWPTTKPNCKDTTEMTQPPPTEDDIVDPPQIIIITKLPKGSTPGSSDKKDKDAKRKPPLGPWMFPPRKNVPKSTKNRRDKNIPTGNSKGQPNRPTRNNFKFPNKMKGWPKGLPPSSKFSWPSTSMRRWTTKRPQSWPAWKSKYSKTNAWRQMLKKWMNGR